MVHGQPGRCAQATVRAETGAAREGLRRRPAINPGQRGCDQQVLHDAVAEGEGRDESWLGLANPEPARRRRVPGARLQLARECQRVPLGIQHEAGHVGAPPLAARGPLGSSQDLRETRGREHVEAILFSDGTAHGCQRFPARDWKVTSTGVVTTLAGTAGSSGTADGAGAAARFNWPTGVSVDGAGNVFVADFGNNAIRKISTSGVVTTIVGVAAPTSTGNFPGPLPASIVSPNGVAIDPSTGRRLRLPP